MQTWKMLEGPCQDFFGRERRQVDIYCTECFFGEWKGKWLSKRRVCHRDRIESTVKSRTNLSFSTYNYNTVVGDQRKVLQELHVGRYCKSDHSSVIESCAIAIQLSRQNFILAQNTIVRIALQMHFERIRPRFDYNRT